MENKSRAKRKLLITAAVVVIFIFVSIPWKNYVYKKNISDGRNLLLQGGYTSAFVKFEKAKMLGPNSSEASSLSDLSKASASDARKIKELTGVENSNDVFALIDRADLKICDLEFDKKLIGESKSDIAKINLTFCSQNSPGYDALITLGVANIRLSEDGDIFKELKPGLRKEAAAAFAAAYEIDPINKTAIEYAIEINKVIGDQKEVDHWQSILDKLENIKK
ncbi:MAG: hypothetical protein WC451_03660 [Patescibacteria group bacterium]